VRARAITEENLHERLGFDGRADELGELAGTFNSLLARLEQAFDSQRRFVANASHELRTPITLERALIEVALADPNASMSSLRRCCQRVLAAGEQQERLIESLLTLARSQGAIVAGQAVDLADLAEELMVARLPGADGVSVETALEPAAVSGNAALIERLIANLVDNAIAYNLPAGGWIEVETRTVSGQAELRIANGGSLVPDETVEGLFEPFRRLDGERTATGHGAGLGLSIVRAIATAHGATVEASPLVPGGLELRVRFPAVSQAVVAAV
jgi:signal transduction histidine kinase